MQKAKSKIVLILCALSLIIQCFSVTPLLPEPVNAAGSMWENQVGVSNGELAKPFNTSATPTDIRVVIARFIKVFLTFLGIIFLALFIYAGFRWMTAGGNENNVSEAKVQIRNAVIGLVVIMMAYAITSFLTDCVFDITTGSTTWMCN